MQAAEYIDQLAAEGLNHFTTGSAVQALGVRLPAARGQLKRLKDRGLIASPLRSFHVIVPPEYRRLGCIPAEQFIDALMSYLEMPYYVALLSAAARHGAGHQSPQALQVMVPKNHPS